VLTKPDTIEAGCHGQWEEVMQGRKYPLAMGWHMLRNPSKAELDGGLSMEVSWVALGA
jgi:hypothetical protein